MAHNLLIGLAREMSADIFEWDTREVRMKRSHRLGYNLIERGPNQRSGHLKVARSQARGVAIMFQLHAGEMSCGARGDLEHLYKVGGELRK